LTPVLANGTIYAVNPEALQPVPWSLPEIELLKKDLWLGYGAF
jgi:hypothetical protein